MEEDQRPDNEPSRIKAKTYEEFLVQLGVKKEEDLITWNPKIKNEPLVRSQSFVCAEYTKPACYRRKPKAVSVPNAWCCDSQATRQLTMLSRLGPRNFYYNNQNIHNINNSYLMGDTTQTLGLCTSPRMVGSL